MTREQYQTRKAAGMCLGSNSCKRPSKPGSRMCESCHEKHKEDRRVWRAKRHQERKLAGLCVECGVPCDRDGVLCGKCAEYQSAQSKKWKSKPRVLKEKARQAREHRAARAEMGLCISCNQPSVNGSLCLTHLRKYGGRAAERRRELGHPPSKMRCGICREPGHRRETCQKRLTVDRVEYASARPGGWQL